MFEPSASRAMPCLAGFRVQGNRPRGILNHGLPTAMLLDLPVALIEVGSHQVRGLGELEAGIGHATMEDASENQ